MSKQARILLAGLYHETNTFSDGITDLQDFRTLLGDELFSMKGDASPLGAIVSLADELGWQLLPTIDCRATPSAMVADRVVEHFWQGFESRALPHLEKGEVDAIYLVLHGAMAAESYDDVEGEIFERIRALPGAKDLPLFAVLDLHANVTSRMVSLADGLVAYRENPHTDAANAAVVTGRQLARALQEKKLPQLYARQLPILWPPTGTATAEKPMSALKAAAIRLEKQGHRAVSIIAGFANADTPDTGVSFLLLTDRSEEEAQAALDELAHIAFANSAAGYPSEWQLQSALDHILASPTGRPALIVEPADNIGGGAPGDCTTVLRGLLERDVPTAAVALCDPQSVKALEGVAIGAKAVIQAGGKSSRLDPGPVTLEVELVSRSDGRFELEDKNSHLASCNGSFFNMGPSAVVRHKNITLLLTSNPTPPFDLGQWRSQGVEPSQFGIINVKAAVAHRRAYDKISGSSYTVDTPGPCSSNLAQLPYKKLRRPVMPLDKISYNANSTTQDLGKAL